MFGLFTHNSSKFSRAVRTSHMPVSWQHDSNLSGLVKACILRMWYSNNTSNIPGLELLMLCVGYL